VDGMGASHIARWNGSSWSALGSGLTGDVNAIVISGSDIYVGGLFTSAGGSNANHIARWNGSSWSPLGSGLSGTVNAIGVDGPTVYAGGAFTTAGVLPADHVAMWDGSNWSSLGSGASDIVNSMDVAGGDTYVGGDFTVAGTKPSFYFGRYNPAIVAVFITSFEAEAEATGVHLRWDIFADENVLGFQIYRRAKGVAAYERLVDNLLPPMARAYIDTDAGFGATYDYVLGVTRADGTELTSPPTEVTTASLAVKLEQNYPNPFNPTTTIAITVPKEEHVTLTVVDMQGGVVARLFDGMLPAGDREFQWNGMDSRGNRVSSGVYFCRLRAGKAVRSEKMTLLK
jgi:hypothetical protein